MLKKVVLGVGLALLVGLLVVGAIIRTLDRTGNVAQGQGRGRGQGAGAASSPALSDLVGDLAANESAAGRLDANEPLGDGQTIAVRNEIGRRGWAGAGTGGYGGLGRTDAAGDGTGTGQAQVDEWITLQGTVTSVDADTLVVQADSGEQVTVENRAWWYAQDQGFTSNVGDRVTVVGLYETGDFEVGQIDDQTTGQTVSIRDESGRPRWAGQGRRGS